MLSPLRCLKKNSMLMLLLIFSRAIAIDCALTEEKQFKSFVDQDNLKKPNTLDEVSWEMTILEKNGKSARKLKDLFFFRGVHTFFCKVFFRFNCGKQSTLWLDSSPTSSPVRKVQSFEPTQLPTTHPSTAPSVKPTLTVYPSQTPTHFPTRVASLEPTLIPSLIPTNAPFTPPSAPPSNVISGSPSDIHSTFPSLSPIISPSTVPSEEPSIPPTMKPTSKPSGRPTGSPTAEPSAMPSKMPISILETCRFSTDAEEATCTNHMSSKYKTESWRLLEEDEFLCSRNKRYRFGMTSDQSLCLCDESRKLWCADDCCQAGLDPFAILEPDGNLVVYSDKRLRPGNMKLWESGTNEGGPKKLKLYNNGNLNIVSLNDTSPVMWEADTDAWVSS